MDIVTLHFIVNDECCATFSVDNGFWMKWHCNDLSQFGLGSESLVHVKLFLYLYRILDEIALAVVLD